MKSCLEKVLKGILAFICLILLVTFISGDDEKEATPTTTTITATRKPTQAPADAHTVAPTEKHLEITLEWSKLGEYGKYYTFNENVEKAEESDKETIIQYFVPAGDYIITNVDRSPWTFVNMYSEKTVITNSGWEEPAEGWVSEMLKPGDSCEITVNEGYYLELHDNDHFKLVQK
jgi:hypothetical protein